MLVLSVIYYIVKRFNFFKWNFFLFSIGIDSVINHIMKLSHIPAHTLCLIITKICDELWTHPFDSMGRAGQSF